MVGVESGGASVRDRGRQPGGGSSKATDRAVFDLRLIEPFVVLAGANLHFSAAAAKLGIGPSALSRQIARLQRELKTTLIGRDGRSHVLTPAGRRFLVHARAIHVRLEGLEDLGPVTWTDAVRLHLLTGTLSGVGSLISDYVMVNPQAEVDVAEGLDVRPVEALRAGRVDIAVDLREACPPGAAFSLVRRVRLGALTSPSHPLAVRSSGTWQDLQGQSVLIPTMPGAASWTALVSTVLADAGVVVRERPSPAVARLRFLLPLIARGEAVFLGPHTFHEGGGDLVAWTPLEPDHSAEVGLVWYPDRASARTRDFVDFVVGQARAA